MTLGTHAIVGAAIATLFPNHPILAFIGGFGSHFILDSIPHWDYKILSLKRGEEKMDVDMKIGRTFIIDLFRIGLDISIGIIISFFLFYKSKSFPYVLLIGSIGAILPDALQFLYFKTRREPLVSLQKFHLYIHAEKELKKPLLGIVCQVAVVIIFYLAVIKIGNLAANFLH